MSSAAPSSIRQMPSLFFPLVVAADVFGVIAVVLIGVWLGHLTPGGFSWSGTGKLDLHPFVMIVGMVFIFGNSTLCYRFLGRLDVERRKIKIVHSVMMVIVLACTAFGLYLVISSVGKNFKTMHAVMGVITISIFVLQFIFAGSIFVLPFSPEWLRVLYMEIHAFFGRLALLSATATCLAGIQLGSQVFYTSNDGVYLSAGAFTAAFTATIVFILTKESYRVGKLSSVINGDCTGSDAMSQNNN